MSPHGLGHATRVAAILHEIARIFKTVDVLLFGETPKWFWVSNLPSNCSLAFHHLQTDIGFVQKGPFQHDASQTLKDLHQFLAFSPHKQKEILKLIESFQPECILSDISPLGVEIGSKLSIPNVLMENFTWDWIYQPFQEQLHAYKNIIQKLAHTYSKASLRLQCHPFCKDIPEAKKLRPVFRAPSMSKNEVLGKLGFSEKENYVLVTTGGISMRHEIKSSTSQYKIVIPGLHPEMNRRGSSIIHLPMNSCIPFPDLVNASTMVIGKAGYGTVSECWGMGIPFMGVFRDSFRESEILRVFCEKELKFREITLPEFLDGSWSELITELLKKQSRPIAAKINGAHDACVHILTHLGKV